MASRVDMAQPSNIAKPGQLDISCIHTVGTFGNAFAMSARAGCRPIPPISRAETNRIARVIIDLFFTLEFSMIPLLYNNF